MIMYSQYSNQILYAHLIFVVDLQLPQRILSHQTLVTIYIKTAEYNVDEHNRTKQ